MTTQVLQLLAVAHDRKGEAQAALQCHERAHSIRVRCQGSKHHETAMSLSRTGVALLAAGNPAEVRPTHTHTHTHTSPPRSSPGVSRPVLEPEDGKGRAYNFEIGSHQATWDTPRAAPTWARTRYS